MEMSKMAQDGTAEPVSRDQILRQMVQPQALASAVGFDPNVSLRRANDYRRRENAHPGNSTPIAYRTTRGDEALRSMRWGLVPSFTRQGDKPDFFRMFNARSETAAEKPSFRQLVGRRHGVVAFSGFYEWKKDEMGERQPYYFHFEDDSPIMLAVLYDTWRQGDDGRSSSSSSSVKVCEQEATASKQLEHCKQKKEEEDDWDKEDDRGSLMFSYAVLTTSAAPRVTWLHERMPIILRGAEDAEQWLRVEGSQQASAFLESHTPYNGSDLVWHPVSKKMNSMRYDGEDCSAAVELKPQKPLPAITTFFKKKSKSPPRSPSSSSGAADVKTETRWTENGEAVGSDLERNGQASSASTTTTTMNSRWEAGAVQGTLDRGCKGVANEAGSPIVPKRMRCDAAELVDLTENDDCSLRVAVSNQPLLPPSFGLKHPRMWKGTQEDVTTPTRQAESDRGQRSPTQAARNPKKARKGKSGGDGSGKRSPGNGGGSPAGRDKNQPNLLSFFQPNG
ncbi:unnamed protein product [Ascophyllum nodosum]